MSRPGTLRQVYDATVLQLRTTRRELGIILVFVVIFPLGILFFLGQIAQVTERTQIIVGAIMMEMGLLNINVIAQGIGQDKDSKLYDLWVSLPIRPVVYVFALAFSILPFALLSAAVTLAAASVWFGLAAFSIPLLLLGLLLVWASTLGLGFLIGVYGSTPRAINNTAQFVGIVMTFFAPVFYPVSVLPWPLQDVAFAWPLTWGVQLLRGILTSSPAAVGVAAAVLGGFVVLWFALIGVGIRWRER